MKTAIRALLIPLMAATLFGQDYLKSIQDKGKKVLDQCIEALGGDRFLSMKNRVEAGMVFSFYRDDINGLERATIYTEYIDAPLNGKLSVRERESFGKKKEEDGAVLFTEREGYDISYRGARPLSNERFDRFTDSTLHDFFYILRQRLKEPGLLVEYQGADLWETRPVDIINITDSQNRVTTVYIDRFNHLPIRQLFRRRNAVTGDMNEEVTLFSKYRDVGNGVQWPYAIQRNRDGEKVYQMFATDVRINQNLADSLFTLPGGIKMLKPE